MAVVVVAAVEEDIRTKIEAATRTRAKDLLRLELTRNPQQLPAKRIPTPNVSIATTPTFLIQILMRLLQTAATRTMLLSGTNR